ncbi:MAG: hypothetical protein K0U74_12310 [Alphaproteobacteria bacterium]|nr:hypothetical protein [Alphaproteobacteria bacterium]
MWRVTLLRKFAVFLVSTVVISTSALAQTPSRDELHRGTVTIITGQHHYLSSRLASDLAAVLDEGDNLRVLGISGRGAISDLIDTLLLKGVDLAIVPADVIDYVEKKRMLPQMKEKLRVVSRLYNKVAHLVAGRGIKTLADLNGKKINVVSNYHGAFVAAQNVFTSKGIDYEPVYLDQRLALERVRSGEIAATLIMSGRPNPLLDEIRDGGPLRFVDIPFSDKLPDVYFPIQLTSADYPDLILPGQSISTVATPSIMLAFNFAQASPRRRKITRFVDAFLSRLGDLQRSPRHPRWRDVNLGAAIAGMQRYTPVAQWLQNNPLPRAVARAKPKKGRRSVEDLFKAFIAAESASGGAEQLLRLKKPELFARFKAWQKRQRQAPTQVAAKPKGKPSLRAVFRQFIDEEISRVGKDEVLALSKKDLFDRFLTWRKQTDVQ